MAEYRRTGPLARDAMAYVLAPALNRVLGVLLRSAQAGAQSKGAAHG